MRVRRQERLAAAKLCWERRGFGLSGCAGAVALSWIFWPKEWFGRIRLLGLIFGLMVTAICVSGKSNSISRHAMQ